MWLSTRFKMNKGGEKGKGESPNLVEKPKRGRQVSRIRQGQIGWFLEIPLLLNRIENLEDQVILSREKTVFEPWKRGTPCAA